MSRIYIDLTDAEMADIAANVPGFFENLPASGWHQDGKRFFREVPAEGFHLRRGGNDTVVRNGNFTFLAPRGVAASQRSELHRLHSTGTTAATTPIFAAWAGDRMVPDADVEIRRSNGNDAVVPEYAVIFNVNFRDLKNSMSQTGEVTHGHVHAESAMDELRCLDYNGPYTDGGNYPMNNYRAYVNFIASDCDLAGFVCLTDHYIGGCQKHHGSICSTRIGHPTSYHKHRFTWSGISW